jgi:homoserine dehydrogenase
MALNKIKIGMVGLGTVGSGVWEILSYHRSLLQKRVGAQLEISRIAVRSKSKRRRLKVPGKLLTTKIEALLKDPEIQIIVELMGDVRASRQLARKALQARKHFVTANKALLAHHGGELFALARENRVDICFEAAVGGGIPILRALREGFVGNEIESLYGILNGTCNFILSEMAGRGSDFSHTLKQAQQLGYAEADPGFDVDGIDTAHKLAILVAIAHGVVVDLKKIHVEGIKNLSPLDLECAKRFGYAIKLLGIAKKLNGRIQARVHPTMIPQNSMLAAVHGVNNAVFLNGDFVGEEMLYGRGAGSEPTASAVVGDIVEVARNILAHVGYTVPPLGIHSPQISKAAIEPIGELRGIYYLRFQAIDRPGVLAEIARILSLYHISISSVYQQIQEVGREVPIVVLTHEATESKVQMAITKINRLKTIKRPTTLIRIEEDLK